MIGSFARDLILVATTQDVVRLTGLDESLVRQALSAVTDALLVPDALTLATEQLVAGLCEGKLTRPIVVAFWDAAKRLSQEQGCGEPTPPLDTTT